MKQYNNKNFFEEFVIKMTIPNDLEECREIIRHILAAERSTRGPLDAKNEIKKNKKILC